MTKWKNYPKFCDDLRWSAQRALGEQTPASLQALSVDADFKKHLIKLRGHFLAEPSEDDMEEIFSVETEILADYYDFDDTKIETEIEIMAPGAEPNFLPGGVAYRKGQPG